ncbi:MAG: filamentous hemagglutinin N-terminal domain-containing protein, partial [Methylacidiphilaceae bacterium]|nr:filamentous hemagglutinin N-terminal domain-containing protein [Acidiphilium sp.]MDD4932725.1 filamentous hemagglutinin N-terminal domain-containing protein [Candidatus Methylacidiphilaceae bacterium]
MKRKTRSYLSALRAVLATAAVAGLAGSGLFPARATVFGPLQLPGHGSVVGGTAVAGSIVGGTQTISTGHGNTAINWAASGGTINTSQPGGFNIGQSAALHFAGGTLPRAVLNVDVSGSPSQIFGTLTGAGNYSIFVANANGITVGPNAVITAPAGLGLIAASVNTAQFLSTGNVPISFATSGPLTVQGNLQSVGSFVLLAGSGAVNVSPIQNAVTGQTFSTSNVTVNGGVGGTFNVVAGIPFFSSFGVADGSGSLTASATSPTTVTLNLGTSAKPYSLAGFFGSKTTVLANGNLVNNGVLNGVNNAIPNLQWTGTLTNNGTIHAELDSFATGGQVGFNGNTSARLAYGGLVN